MNMTKRMFCKVIKLLNLKHKVTFLEISIPFIAILCSLKMFRKNYSRDLPFYC